MRAVIVREFGDVEKLDLGEMPEPQCGPGEVVVQVQATAVNFVDLLVIAGKYQFLPERPFVPGKGPAGIVVAFGAGVGYFSIGDRVLAMAEHGGYGERVAVSAQQCYRLPDAMSFSQAASMSLAYDTAWFALRERARCRKGETVLVLGATGGVGHATLQLAKAMGLTVLAGIASPDKADLVRAAAADVLIDLSVADLRDGLRAQVHAATEGKGADIVIDMLGGDFFDAALRAVAWRGRMVVVGFAAGRIPTIKANYLLLKNIEVSGLQISDYRKRTPGLVAQCFSELFAFHEEGKIRPAPCTILPLDAFAQGLKMVGERTAQGRVVLSQEA